MYYTGFKALLGKPIKSDECHLINELITFSFDLMKNHGKQLLKKWSRASKRRLLKIRFFYKISLLTQQC